MNDPTDNIKKMLIRKNLNVKFCKEAQDDEMSKTFSIFSDNNMRICEKEDLYSNTISWVMGDFQKKHVRAFMVIKEILMSYLTDPEFGYG